jgi:hypothetical protein
LKLGCGGSSDEFIQREHSGDLFGHDCRFAAALPPKNQPNGIAEPFDAFSPGQKLGQRPGIAYPSPRQAFEQQVDLYCKSFLVASKAEDIPDLLALLCDSHATQKAHAKPRAFRKTAMEKG